MIRTLHLQLCKLRERRKPQPFLVPGPLDQKHMFVEVGRSKCLELPTHIEFATQIEVKMEVGCIAPWSKHLNIARASFCEDGGLVTEMLESKDAIC